MPHILQSCHKSEEGEAESDLDGEDSGREEQSLPNTFVNKLEEKVTSRSGSHVESQNSVSSDHSGCSSVHSSDDEFGEQESKLEKSSISPKDAAVSNGLSKSPIELGEQDAPTPTTAEPPDTLSTDGLSRNQEFLRNTDDQSLSDSKAITDSILPGSPTIQKTNYPLHKTVSIFFRALPATVTEAELRELCSSQPGFLRLALWDPVPERRFTRHGWATYKPTVNIKKVCWALNTSPLLREKITMPNGELGATVNRELAQRVRPLTPLTRHKPIMRQDLILAAQLIARLDAENNLWETEKTNVMTEEMEDTDSGMGKSKDATSLLHAAIQSQNPLLQNLTDYLVEEGGSEEEALLAETSQTADDSSTEGNSGRSGSVVLESDPELAKVLDFLILYLRVVHSVDFYAGAVYPLEDTMPHRCGILHARGDRGLNPTLLTGGRCTGLVFTQKEVDEHSRNFALKLRVLINVPNDLTDEEMKKLGMRDPDKVAEDFVESNIQKRTGKKKPFKVVWICPLSDKKFREPIFVRKHIFNKHMDKIEAAKKDGAIFYNNYLRDPRRPSLPEAPFNLHNQNVGGGIQSNRGPRGQGRAGGGTYRCNYRGNSGSNNSNFGSTYGRGFTDYYDVATQQQQQQQQAMAAVAAAAAAALYPNAAADLYNLAAVSGAGGGVTSGGPRPGMRRRANSPLGGRSYDNRRRPNDNYNTNNNNRRPPYRGDRGMVSYNDLDDPDNDN